MAVKDGVIIVGAGAIGCSIAYHLARRSITSQVIDREGIASRASGKAWAIWRYPPTTLLVADLDLTLSVPSLLADMKLQSEITQRQEYAQRMVDLHWIGYYRLPEAVRELEERGGINVGYRELPLVKIALSEEIEEEYKKDLSAIRSAGHYEGDWLKPDELRAIFPNISPQIKGGVCFPGFKVEPYKYTLCLAQAAEKMGCTIRSGEVVGFGSQGSKVTSVVLSSGTEIEATTVVLAMGPWIGQATSWLGRELPAQLLREQCIRVELSRPFPSYSIWTTEGAIIPESGNQVLLHGFEGWPDLVTNFDSSLTEESKLSAIEMATRLFPEIENGSIVEHRGDLECWAPGLRMRPVLGRHPQWDNVYLASRFGSRGIMLSLSAGELMAEFIARGGQAPYRVEKLLETLSPTELKENKD
ncbi:MAG: FAD-binding oxidoreductase [Dehalococcoidia bacterium]|nr:FAD-binding oxidoreductase [Dehalococcoidia bacterium]